MQPELIPFESPPTKKALSGLLNEVAVAGRTSMHPAVLFRGVGALDAQCFRNVLQQARLPLFDYKGGNSPRTDLASGVFTASEFSPTSTISNHQEMSYERRYPDLLFFYCATPSAEGGSTTLVDAAALLTALPAQIVADFRRRGVRYVQRMTSEANRLGRSWPETFGTHDRDVVAAHLEQDGARYEWVDDLLTITRDRAAVRKHRHNATELWFNQVDQWHESSLGGAPVRERLVRMFGVPLPHAASYADGSEVSSTTVSEIQNTCAAIQHQHAWQAGDLLVVDNEAVMHGRMPYKGKRELLVAMTGGSDDAS